MRTGYTILILAVIIILAAAAVWFFRSAPTATAPGTGNSTSTTATSTLQNETLTLAGGKIAINYPSDFGLAVTSTQVQVHSYIPPCDQDFNYCLYYNGNAYQGTNFESAGVRVSIRSNLTSENSCLTAQPSGFTGLTPQISRNVNYATSLFSPLGDAAAGHYANGDLYRLWYENNCYEFETRVGASQFANYPAGTIKEFTSADQSSVLARVRSIVKSAMLTSDNSSVVFPGP